MKKIIIFSFLIVIITVSYLFSPKPVEGTRICGRYTSINKYMGFTMNCDGTAWLIDAKDPSLLLQQNSIRQDRPLYAILTTIVGFPIQYLLDRSGLIEKIKLSNRQDLVGYYIAYLLESFIFLLITLLLFYSLAMRLAPGINEVLIYLLAIFLISNYNMKAFFWSPFLTGFTFTAPLIGLNLMFNTKDRHYSFTRLLGISFGAGAFLLLYGNAILILPCLIYALYIRKIKKEPLKALANTVMLIGFFALPTFIWIFILKLHNVTYYNHEMATYHQFVWVIYNLKLPFKDFVRAFIDNMYYFFLSFRQLMYLIIGIALLQIFLFIKKTKLSEDNSRYFEYLIVAIAISFLFYMFLGFYNIQLTYSMVPLFLLLAVCQLKLLPNPRIQILILTIIALCWHLQIALMHGPYSM